MNTRASTKLTPAQVNDACNLMKRGVSMTETAARLGVHRSTLYRAFRQDAIDHMLRLGANRSTAPPSPTRRRAMLLEARRESRLVNRADSLDPELSRFLDAALDEIAEWRD